MATITNSADARFRFDVLNESDPVLVNFHAEWCSQCRRVAPVLDELAQDWDGRIKVVKVDVERNPHLAKRFHIRKVPTLVLFDGGEEKARLVEVLRREAIEEAVTGALSPG
jgi:thioredoxin 1